MVMKFTIDNGEVFLVLFVQRHSICFDSKRRNENAVQHLTSEKFVNAQSNNNYFPQGVSEIFREIKGIQFIYIIRLFGEMK